MSGQRSIIPMNGRIAPRLDLPPTKRLSKHEREVTAPIAAAAVFVRCDHRVSSSFVTSGFEWWCIGSNLITLAIFII